MKNEVYSCLKMLEAFHNRIVNLTDVNRIGSAGSLQHQYKDMCNILEEHLTPDQFKMIHKIKIVNFGDVYRPDEVSKKLMEELVVASEVTIAYLRSLNMNLDKELIKEKMEIRRQKEELELKQREVESLQKMLENSVKVIGQIPELIRSKVVEETKKSHREIEKHTNPDTKSQKSG